MNTCPCSPNVLYDKCCGPFIDGIKIPPTALELMCSRYTAFTQGNTQYIGDTHKGKAAENYSPENTKAWIANCVWLGLDILDSKTLSPNTATVSFKAHLKEKNVPQVMQEKSLFEWDGSRWFYVGGTHVMRNATPKLGRNDHCPCKSGEKYKKCCSKNDQ
jgi:SEC-C motif-containing protein